MKELKFEVVFWLVIISFVLGLIVAEEWPSDKAKKLKAEQPKEHDLLCIQMYKIQSKHNYILQCSGVLK